MLFGLCASIFFCYYFFYVFANTLRQIYHDYYHNNKCITENETLNENITKPLIVNYKYNPAIHFKKFMKKYYDYENNENYENHENYENYDIDDIILDKIKEDLDKIKNPTLTNFKTSLDNYGYKDAKYIKPILHKLKYKIIKINENDENKIVNHFLKNKKKFSMCKTGFAPYIHFYDIFINIIDELHLPVNLILSKY